MEYIHQGVKIVDLANQIYLDLGGDDPFYNITKIANYLRGQVGTLNSLINEDFFINQWDEMVHPIELHHNHGLFISPPDPTIGPQYPISEIYPSGYIPKFTKIHNDEAALLKRMFMIFYYDSKFRRILHSLSENLVLQVESDGQKISLVNRNSIAQSYMQMKKTEIEELKKLINGYLRNRSNPRSVAGDDTMGYSNEYGLNGPDSALDATLSRFYSW